jgi:hypothetical protein
MDQMASYRLKITGIDAIETALIAEAKLRRGRSFKEWTDSEAKAVWSATRDFAQKHGLRVPNLAEVVKVEHQACGHSDYAAKWALYAVELTFAVVAAAA